uniref:Uncharacterized protein n=1 Tax=Anguilla anguilla TaxID=7936 RepID=A0A0E9QH94_ANGAN
MPSRITAKGFRGPMQVPSPCRWTPSLSRTVSGTAWTTPASDSASSSTTRTSTSPQE